MADDNLGVTFTVKELLSMLENTISEQMDKINIKLDVIVGQLNEKADRAKLYELDARVSTLDAATLKRGGPVDDDLHDLGKRVYNVELKLAGTAALSAFQRWLIGSVGVAVFGAAITMLLYAVGSG
jgi:hypothetical protein